MVLIIRYSNPLLDMVSAMVQCMNIPFLILDELYIMFLVRVGSFIPALPNTCGDHNSDYGS